MSVAAFAALAFLLTALTVHLVSILLAARHCRRSPHHAPTAGRLAAISLVRTIRDIGPHEEETLRSSFGLSHPEHEVLFCAASECDPAVPVVRRLIAQHPHVPARLLIGETRISVNPKLNNMLKGWREARYDWIVFADSNLLLPADYLERVLASWTPRTGIVCAPPIASRPSDFWGEVECAFLNTYQARWQFAADAVGLGFAQGKTMLFNRTILERHGGIAALASELAEDAAATKVVRGAARHVRLAGGSFFQPLGSRTAAQVMARQLRWAQLRRQTFAGWFALELLTGSLAPLAAAAILAPYLGISPVLAAAAIALLWFGGEAILARIGGWHISWRAPAAWILRDLLIPVIWLRAWLINDYEWGGHRIAWHSDGSTSLTTQSSGRLS